MSEFSDVRLFVLQRAIAALIMTHPDPAGFAAAFRAMTGLAQVDHALVPGATEQHRREAAAFARELLDFADAVAASRSRDTDREG